MNDTAAFMQQQYDEAVFMYGADSPQAKQAEVEALNYFKGKPAPVTPAVQVKEESWAS